MQLMSKMPSVGRADFACHSGRSGCIKRPLSGIRNGPLPSYPCPRKACRLCNVGKQAHGEPYDTDDCDFLSGIAHYVGALLSHACLSEERQASAELEALHRFSVFCLHDLKNLAARLSLIAQNVGSHGQDPSFQASAMRTVADTAKQITALVSKLSLKSFEPVTAKPLELVDIPALVEEVVAPLSGAETVPIDVRGGPVSPVFGIREQVHQVFLNVVLNAKQAIARRWHNFDLH